MPEGFIARSDNETLVELDPSGKWVAVYTGEGIVVRSIDGEQEYPISPGFGIEPRWCDECSELFYRDGNRFYSVKVRFDPDFQWDQPKLIWEVEDFIDTQSLSYDVTPDGQKLLVVKRVRKLPRDKIHIIQNWQSRENNASAGKD
jgi:hypothetical protein